MLPLIESPAKAALFFDFDGTLVDLAPTPDAVNVKPEIQQLLLALYEICNGALAIITGRDLSSLDKLLRLPHIPASGSHGAEWRFNDEILHSANTELLLPVNLIKDCENFAKKHRLIFESKRYSVALHFRDQPEIETLLNAFLEAEIGRYASLCVQEGKFVKEIKPAAINKGVALARFMQHTPWHGRQAWYFGDDVTDEAAFAWVNANNGVSVKVGAGDTVARYRLGSPADLEVWLRDFSFHKESRNK